MEVLTGTTGTHLNKTFLSSDASELLNFKLINVTEDDGGRHDLCCHSLQHHCSPPAHFLAPTLIGNSTWWHFVLSLLTRIWQLILIYFTVICPSICTTNPLFFYSFSQSDTKILGYATLDFATPSKQIALDCRMADLFAFNFTLATLLLHSKSTYFCCAIVLSKSSWPAVAICADDARVQLYFVHLNSPFL